MDSAENACYKPLNSTLMTQRRWLRIIPIALIMYTISYVDRTNISLALDPNLSSMMKDLFMDDKMKGEAAGIFFIGYILLQLPGGYLASHWSARKIISIFLVFWGICAVGCGMVHTFRQFEVMRFLLGVAESGVFPATLVLLSNWFPRSERARANAYWYLCQPLAVAGTAPITSQLLHSWGWQTMIILEGALPFLWLPIWWFGVRDHPRQAIWVSDEERDFLEKTLRQEATELEPPRKVSVWRWLAAPSVFIMVGLYFLHNCAVYGCMTFFTVGLKGQGFSSLQYGLLFALPYAITAVIMVAVSWHSDKKSERKLHVAAMYLMSGASLIISVLCREHFWVSYAFLCLAIPGPFAAMGPFWTIASETLPKAVVGLVVGLVNAFGNLGGYYGPSISGWLMTKWASLVSVYQQSFADAHVGWLMRMDGAAVAFMVLGTGMLGCAALALLLPKAAKRKSAMP